jgi:neurotransmitter:Na+ symporter, NSS family
MTNNQDSKREKWSSSFGFILACVGSAVGLGNLWKFPYITYENGGGAFVIVYLVAILLVGMPIMLCELILGRKSQQNVFSTFKVLSKNHWFWKSVGALCIVTAFTILSFYSVVTGWALKYMISSLDGSLIGITSETSGKFFGGLVGNGSLQIVFHTIVMGLTSIIVVRGASSIEKAVKFLMPTLFILIVIIMSISISNYGAGESFSFLFNPDFSKLTGKSILEALGHAFFTLSLGMGAMITYGSYLKKEESLVKSTLWISFFDTVIAIMACLMIFPILFGTKMPVSESAAILFTSLTVQFNALPGGQFISALFYLLVVFAALSSTVSLLQPVVAYMEENFKFNRMKSIIFSSAAIWFVGIFSALSNGASKFFTDLKIFDRLDYLASNWFLTLGALFISLFTGFVLTQSDRLKELNLEQENNWFKLWVICIKFISPALVILILLFKIGLFE